MISEFDRTNLRILHSEIEEALQLVALKHGIAITPGRARFSSTSCVMKIELSTKTDGVVQSKERSNWECLATTYGLKKEWLDQTFISQSGMKFKVTGLNPRARRMPVLAIQAGTDLKYKFTVTSVAQAFKSK